VTSWWKETPDRVLLVVLLSAAVALAQPARRVATTVDALATYPVFFHGREVIVRAALERKDDVLSIVDRVSARRIHALAKGRTLDEGDVEARGEFWDLGRLQADDARLAGVDVQRLLDRVHDGRWPGPNQLPVLVIAAAAPPAPPPAPTIHSIALDPRRYEGQRVTVTGRFRGANLYGDLPKMPGRSRWDFVLQSADAAIWVSGLRPRGKGFDLDRDARVDTGRWLEVSGVVGGGSALVWIDAQQIRLGVAEPAAVVEVPVPTPGPPPTVTFSLPTEDETDIERSILVRVQFSRDMDPASFRDRVRARYALPGPEGSAAQPPSFATVYREGNRVLEIKFSAPLERFRTVEIELLDGIAAFDGAKLQTPWTVRFTTGPQ
jgi:hypothetical protein